MINRELLNNDEGIAAILKNLKKRNQPQELFKNIQNTAGKYKEKQQKLELLQAERNKISKDVGILKAKGEEPEKVESLLTEVKTISDKLKILKEEKEKSEEEYVALLINIPNILDDDIPAGADENDNIEIRTFGKKPEFNFKVLPHYEIGELENLIDFERGVKLAGSRFYVYNENIARLERDLISFMLKTHEKNGYKERMVPFLVKDDCMKNTGQFPKFKEEYYRMDKDELNLIPTAEVPLTNLYYDEILKEEDLPVNLTAATACFRREAGSAGKDTRGLIRVHQFNKVELVKFCLPAESTNELEKLTANAEAILKKLELHYRVVLLCSADTSFSSAKTYDIEVWMPGLERWLEISSCSNFRDFQARRAMIRYKEKESGKNKLVHTLNGSGVAAGRLVAALMEYHQTADKKIDFEKIYEKISI
ncbi:MAG: serine--tRNA ligase [Spirochaetia bacterium]|nr:serine--tRNA ligase [Spirochaetia bacterium]